MKTAALIKANILSSGMFSKAYFRQMKEKDRLWLIPIAGLGMLSGLGTFMFMLISNYQAMLTAGVIAGKPETVLLVASAAASFMLFFVSVPIALSVFFQSKENRLLLSLPVSVYDIIISKSAYIYIFTQPINLFFFIPAVVVYLQWAGPGVMPILAALFTVIFQPLIPICIAAAAAALLSKLSGRGKHKSLLEIAGMLTGVILIVAIQTLWSRQLMEGDTAAIAALLNRYIGMLEKTFFISRFAAVSIGKGSILYALLYAATSAAVFCGVFLLMSRLILNALRSAGQTASVRKKRRADSRSTQKHHLQFLKHSTPGAALMLREWRILSSNSTFLFEAAGELLVLPIILIVFSFSMPDEYMSQIMPFFNGFPAAPLLVFAALVLFSTINSIASTSISREGRSINLSKSIPVSGREQVLAKLYFQLALFCGSWLLNIIIMFAIFRFPAAHLLYLLPGGPAFIMIGFALGLGIDLSRPVLNWDNPQQAMKQNMNVLAGMGMSLLPAIAGAAVGSGLYLAGLPVVLIGLIITLAAAAAAILLLKRLLGTADRRYAEIIPT